MVTDLYTWILPYTACTELLLTIPVILLISFCNHIFIMIIFETRTNKTKDIKLNSTVYQFSFITWPVTPHHLPALLDR